MGTPIQFGDVIRALEVCLWIKRNCFETINNASGLYIGFKQDVIDLEKRLEQFQSSFEKAVSALAGDHDRAARLKLEADQLVGDFVATLQDCKKLVRKHARFEDGRATALENAFWHTNTQPAVTELRSRLQSHHYKLWLFIEPYKIDMIADILGDTREILALLRQKNGLIAQVRLPEIPSAICGAFENALQRDAPERIPMPSEIPLREGVDALSRHYRECTFQSDSLGIGPGQLSNLSLLKAHWLYETIESSEALADSRPGSLFRRVLEQLGQGIELQYQKRNIQSWPENVFSDLDMTEFAIWPVKVVPKAPVLTNPAGREEQLAKEPLICPYPGERQDLYIFKVNEKLLRLVESRSPEDNPNGAQNTERFIHLDEDRFIPLYTVAPGTDKGSINMTHGKGAALASYEFKTRSSIHKVQQAFTGFQTISWSTGVWCSLTYKSGLLRSNQELGHGEVQLWTEPGSLSTPAMPSSPTSTIGSSERSMNTGSSYTLASRTFSTFDSRVTSVREREDGGEMIISALPKAPLLVVFVKGKKHFSMWQFDISSLELGRPRTISNRNGSDLYRLTLQIPKLEKFSVKRLTAENVSQLDMWNLHALQNSSNKKMKIKDKSVPLVEKLEATALDLDFETKDARTRFENHFKFVSTSRQNQMIHFDTARHVARSEGNRPTRRLSHGPTLPRRDSAQAGSETTIRGIPPTLNEIPRFSIISLSDSDTIRSKDKDERLP